MIKQFATSITVEFDDDALADYHEDMIDKGLAHSEFLRIWFHTHPMASVTPSRTDEDTFKDKFGNFDWAVMAILGTTGNMSARLSIRPPNSPSVELEMSTRVDWNEYPKQAEEIASLLTEWRKEAEELILPPPVQTIAGVTYKTSSDVPLVNSQTLSAYRSWMRERYPGDIHGKGHDLDYDPKNRHSRGPVQEPWDHGYNGDWDRDWDKYLDESERMLTGMDDDDSALLQSVAEAPVMAGLYDPQEIVHCITELSYAADLTDREKQVLVELMSRDPEEREQILEDIFDWEEEDEDDDEVAAEGSVSHVS